MRIRKMMLALALSFAAGHAAAQTAVQNAVQNYPNKPLRLVVPFAAGGPVDTISRPFAEKLSEQLGQPVVIDYIPGAGTLIGSDNIAKSAPDGYSLLVLTVDILILQSSHPKLPFDVFRDFAPVGVTSRGTIALVVDPKLPIRNSPEFVAYAKANPGKLSFGSTGVGGSLHLGAEMLKIQANIDMTHVPYKGVAPALADIMGGHLSWIFSSMAGALPLARSGKVRAIAVASLNRNPLLPDVPTIAESGYPGFEVAVINGIIVPAKTPRPIINHLSQAMIKLLATQDIKERFAKSGVDAASNTPEEFATMIRNEVDKWGKVVKAINFVQKD